MTDLINAIAALIPDKYHALALSFLVLVPRAVYAYNQPGGTWKSALMAMFLGSSTAAPTAPAVPAGQGSPASTASSKLPSIVAIGAGFALLLGTSGCGSLAKTTYTAVSGVQITVEAAMTAWGDYVKTYGATDDQRAKVKAAYGRYQNSAVTVVDAQGVVNSLTASSDPATMASAQANLTAANAASAQCLADLIDLLRSFGVKI